MPRFLVEATECLENHLGSEGLFRKSGSSVRQKQLKVGIQPSVYKIHWEDGYGTCYHIFNVNETICSSQ